MTFFLIVIIPQLYNRKYADYDKETRRGICQRYNLRRYLPRRVGSVIGGYRRRGNFTLPIASAAQRRSGTATGERDQSILNEGSNGHAAPISSRRLDRSSRSIVVNRRYSSGRPCLSSADWPRTRGDGSRCRGDAMRGSRRKKNRRTNGQPRSRRVPAAAARTRSIVHDKNLRSASKKIIIIYICTRTLEAKLNTSRKCELVLNIAKQLRSILRISMVRSRGRLPKGTTTKLPESPHRQNLQDTNLHLYTIPV